MWFAHPFMPCCARCRIRVSPEAGFQELRLFTAAQNGLFEKDLAAWTNKDIQRQLNSPYAQGVTSAVQAATGAQSATILGSALGTGKAAAGLGDTIWPITARVCVGARREVVSCNLKMICPVMMLYSIRFLPFIKGFRVGES